MTLIYVTDKVGATHTVEAKDGLSLMEVLRSVDVGIEGECEGSLACATCHVWVDQEWMVRTGEPTEEEAEMLDCAFLVRPTSRLCCQILVRPVIAGLRVAVPHN